MTQSNLLELAQQGDPQAIAALMNQSLQPRGMTAIVERMGDRLSVLLEADQVPNRQTLTAFVKRGISNLGIESIRSVKVLGQQTGTNLPVWTQDLALELPTTAAEAIDAVDLSLPVDSTVDLSLTDDDDELETLWVAPSDEQSQDSLADLLAEEPADDLQSLFDEQPEELEAGTDIDNPLEDLRSMFGEQSETDFPPLEESSFNGASLNSMDAIEANSLQDLFGGEDLEEDPLSQLGGMFSESTFTESSLGANDLDSELDSDLDNDLSDELGLESSNSDSLADLFGDRPPDEDLGIFEENPPDEEEFQDLFGEAASSTTSEAEELDGLLEQPSAGAIAPETWLLLDENLPSESTEESKADDPLMNFLDEEVSPDLSLLEDSSSEETLLSALDEEDSLLDFLDKETEQSEGLLGERFAGIEVEVSEPLLFNEPRDELESLDNTESANELVNEPLLFDEFDEFDELDELSDEPVSSHDSQSVHDIQSVNELFDERRNEPLFSDDTEAVNEPLLFNESRDGPVPLDSLETDSPETVDEPMSSPEAPSFVSSSSSSLKSFQEQQALADFFADDPLADFLPQPVQPPGEEFLEGGLSEPMAAATAQDYFNSPEPSIDSPEPSTDFRTENLNSDPLLQPELEDDQDFLDRTFQPAKPTDLFSERMDSLEAEFPQEFQADLLEQPDRDFLGNSDTADSDNWDGALENPLPDVEVNQADAVSPLESLTDDPDLHNLQTEVLFGESSFDRYPEAEPTLLQDAEPTAIQELQPERWDLDSDDEPTAIENPLPSTVGGLRGRSVGADALEDLTVSLPNLPDDGYEQQVAYPSLNDPTQAPPQPKGSPWLFPLILFGLVGWLLALIGFSYWLKERDVTQPPIVQPSAGSPVPSIPPAPTNPASPSSALPNSEDAAAALPAELPKKPDWMAVE